MDQNAKNSKNTTRNGSLEMPSFADVLGKGVLTLQRAEFKSRHTGSCFSLAAAVNESPLHSSAEPHDALRFHRESGYRIQNLEQFGSVEKHTAISHVISDRAALRSALIACDTCSL